ncbi:hypothetical protein ACFQZ4_12030 [Catellatospora coxensis]|uniref:Uncharacterized protein n=1 Tax=Catellatospora coxensis TaxID=310354 RepID=A0A8J3KZ47_9ACTN|nr:hypothetical protein [Catellatospora coxensis]GIG08114.1 hypothetical protein Cco03nite_48140 [Catellatospora coxensis]
MKRNGPIITLLAGLALAAVLITVNLSLTKGGGEPDPAGLGAAVASAAPAASTPPSPTVAASASAAAPDAPAEKVNATWAGTVDGGGATIAIAVTDGVAVAYLCDGKKAEVWLQGTAADGKLALTGKKGATLTGTFGGGKATGTVTANGRKWTFTVKAVAKPSGLYRATATVRNAKVVGGWIVLPDGSQVGVVTVDDVPQPAPAIDPATGAVTVDGAALTAAPVTGVLAEN